MRTAAIITNYNMPERTDSLVGYLQKHVKSELDIVVVDNGSDIKPPSKYTWLKLKKNVQTTGGWLAGLNALTKGYFAYWFLITSTEFVDGLTGDPLTPMLRKLIDDPIAVGVHNALTPDYRGAWDQLVRRGGTGCRETWMIDNISSLYRADWFDSIGRFDPELIYAWGIDLETCYLARKQKRTLWVCEDAPVKKVTNIGYAMNRMNMSAEDRSRLAWMNMYDVLERKYGKGGYYRIKHDYIEMRMI